MANDSVQITVRVTDATGAGFTQLNRAIRDLRTEARNSGQALTTLSTRATAASAALRALAESAEKASTKLRTLAIQSAATAAALAEVRSQSSRAATSLRTLSTRSEDAASRMRDLGDSSRTLRSDLDELNSTVTRLGAGLNALRPRLGTVTVASRDAGDAMGKLRAAALLLSPALLPIAAAAAPIAISLAAATAATAAFGLAVGQQVADIAQASQAQKKYDDAVSEHGAASKQAAEAELAFQRELEQMPPAAREAVAALSAMKAQYKSWSDSVADDTTPVLTHSIQTLSATFPKLTPTVRGASEELDRFIAIAAGGVSSRGFDEFMARFDDFAQESLSRARIGLIEFVQAADAGKIGANVETFLDYARENSPLVGDTLMNLTEALSSLLVGASDTGVSLLGLVNALARLASAVPPELVGTLLSMYAAIRLLRLGMAGLSAVITSGLVARFAAFVTTARTSGVGAALTGMAAGMTRMQKAALGLGVLAVGAVAVSELAEKARGAPPDVDRLTTALKELNEAGYFTGELRETFGDVDGLIERIRLLGEEQEKANRTVLGFRVPVLDDMADAVSGAVNDITDGEDSLNALKDDFESLDQALAGLAAGGNADQAADAFRMIKDAAREQGVSVREVNELFPEYRDTLAAIEAEQRLVAEGMGLFGEQALRTQEALEQQKLSADGLRQSIQALNDVNRSGLDGMIAFEEAVDKASQAARDNAGVLRMRNGQLVLAGERQREAAQSLNDLAQATDEAAAAAREQGASWSQVNGIYRRGRAELIESAQAMGLTRDQARRLANEILQIPDRKVRVEGDIEDLERQLREARRRLNNVPDSRKAQVRAEISQLETALLQARGELNSLQDKTVTVTVDYISRFLSGGPYVDPESMPGVIARAHGGIVGAAGGGPRSAMTLVGEQGPEIVRLPFGSTVIPAGQSRQKLTEHQREQRREERQALRASGALGAFQVSHFGAMAGANSTPFRQQLGSPDDVKSLVGALNEWRGTIKATTHGRAERMLLKDLDVAGKALIKNAKLHDKVSAELDKARDKLSGLREAAQQMRDSVRHDVQQMGDVTRGAGSGQAFTAGTIISNLTAGSQQADDFADALRRLKKRGLGKAAIRDIAEAGIEGGGLETANALLQASDKEIAQINSLQQNINASAADAGKYAANAMYGAGIKAAEGVVAGLEKSKARIERAMEGIAKQLEKAIKKALQGLNRHASGGIVGAAGGGPRSALTLVGEQGPEIVGLPFGSRVWSNADSRRFMSGGVGPGGGRPIQVNLILNGRVLARELIDPLRYEIRDRGGNVQAALGRGSG